jgi:hypothetical protein
MEVYKIKTDPDTLKKIEELGRKIDHEIWMRQQKRKRQQKKARVKFLKKWLLF